MATAEFQFEVQQYLEQNGFEYVKETVRNGCTVFDCRRNGTRVVCLAVSQPERAVTTDHVGYLLRSAKKVGADETMLASSVGLTEDARAAVDRYGVVVLDEFGVPSDRSPTAQTDLFKLPEEQPRGSTAAFTRRSVLVGGLIGGAAVLPGNIPVSLPFDAGDISDKGETVDDPEGEYIEFLDHDIYGATAPNTSRIGVEGRVENISGNELTSVTVTVTFFGQSGETAEASDLGFDFGAEAVWDFDVQMPDDSGIHIVDTYEVSASVTT